MGKRRRLKPDRLSNLPDNIVEKILVNLPIKDAVRTCLLSSKWKYRWASIPDLVFADSDFQYRAKKFVTFVDRILLIHRGPIQKFALSIEGSLDKSAFESWMQFLSRINIKEFKLKVSGINEEMYKIPSLFTFQQLSSLELSGCFFNPPPLFEGFRYLKILHLHNIDTAFEEEIVENTISNCPNLEDLSLDTVDTSNRLKVNVPKLQSFHFRGYFTDIYLAGAPHLNDVYIFLSYASTEILAVHRVTNLNNVLGCLTGIKNLSIHGFFLQFLGMFNIPGCCQLPVSYHHLNKLSLKVNFEDLNEIKVTICLLKSSPNLQKLEIHANANEDIAIDLVGDFWEEHGHLDCSMNHLNVIQFDDLFGSQSKLEFIKFLLANSPVLEVLYVTSKASDIDDDKLTILKKLLKFRRASTKAEIEYKNDYIW